MQHEALAGLLSQGDVKREFGIGSDRLARARKRGDLKVSRVGRRNLYVRCEVFAWLRSNAGDDGKGRPG